jgi:hypothetical protein
MKLKVIGFIKEIESEYPVNVIRNSEMQIASVNPNHDLEFKQIQCTKTTYTGKTWLINGKKQIIVAYDDLTNQILESSEKAFIDLNKANLEISRLNDDLRTKEEDINSILNYFFNMSFWKRLKFLFTRNI